VSIVTEVKNSTHLVVVQGEVYFVFIVSFIFKFVRKSPLQAKSRCYVWLSLVMFGWIESLELRQISSVINP